MIRCHLARMMDEHKMRWRKYSHKELIARDDLIVAQSCRKVTLLPAWIQKNISGSVMFG